MRRMRWASAPVLAAAALVLGTAMLPPAQAQTAVVSYPAYSYSARELEVLVGPIALYPDDLVALVLPAATNPLQIVQAERFLAKRARDPRTPLDARWDDAVKSLLNYPEIVTFMSDNLDWTVALGEAVAANPEAVLDAVQAFRSRSYYANHLRSDDKQIVVVERDVIRIVPANPQVIYVPIYNPTTVVVQGPPSWHYHPHPYPVYHYPYQPGSSFIAGLVWGAALSSLWNGNYYQPRWADRGHGHHSIYVHRSYPPEAQRPLAGSPPPPPRDSLWRPSRRPEQIAESVGRPHPGRVSGESPVPVPVMRSFDRSERAFDRPVERAGERSPERRLPEPASRAVSPRESAPALDGAERRGRDTGRDIGRDSERDMLRDTPRAVVPSRVAPPPDISRDELPTRPGRDAGRDMGRDIGRDAGFPRANREDAPEGRMVMPQRVEREAPQRFERPAVINERSAPREMRDMREPSREMGDVRGARDIREPSRDLGEIRGQRDLGEARGAREPRGEGRESRDFGGGGAREGREGREGRGF